MGALHLAIRQILFHQRWLADNLPNFPTTKVSLHTIDSSSQIYVANAIEIEKICVL